MHNQKLRDLDAQQRKTLERIYALYYGQMYKKAYAVLRNRQDAEDAVQEAFYRVCLNAEVFEQPDGDTTAALIYTYTRNVVINHYHKKKRRSVILHDIADADSMTDDGDCDLALLLAREEATADVRRAVDALPERYREVIVLKYYEDKKNTEIALLLGEGQNVINGRIFRAKKMLRKSLARKNPDRKEDGS